MWIMMATWDLVSRAQRSMSSADRLAGIHNAGGAANDALQTRDRYGRRAFGNGLGGTPVFVCPGSALHREASPEGRANRRAEGPLRAAPHPGHTLTHCSRIATP